MVRIPVFPPPKQRPGQRPCGAIDGSFPVSPCVAASWAEGLGARALRCGVGRQFFAALADLLHSPLLRHSLPLFLLHARNATGQVHGELHKRVLMAGL